MNPSRSKKSVVTGAAGFIGSHLCEALLRIGHEVVGIDNFDEFYDPAVKQRNLNAIRKHPRFSFIEGDIRDAELVSQCIDSSTFAVVHLAARAGVRPSIEDPDLYFDVNVRGTLKLLECCAAFPTCRFIFGSSSSVYGKSSRVPFREDDAAAEPISPYAASKRSGELLCHTFHHLYGMPVTCLRFFTVYGPRQRPDLAIHKFARLIAAGRPIPVFGDGSMRRDYTYVEDIVNGIIRAMDRCAGFSIYNLGNSSPIALSDLIPMIERALGKKAKIDCREPSRGDVDCTFADITKAAKELDYCPRTDFATGLDGFVEWLNAAQPVPGSQGRPAESGEGDIAGIARFKPALPVAEPLKTRSASIAGGGRRPLLSGFAGGLLREPSSEYADIA